MIYGMTSAARSLVGLLLVPIYTRAFAVEDYGRIDTLTTMVAFLSLVLTLGMDTAVALYFYDNAGEDDRATMVTTAITTRVLLSSAVAFLITLLAAPLSWLLFQSYDAVIPVRLAVWTAPVNAMVGFLIELLRLNRRPWNYSIVALVNLLVGVSLSIFFVVRQHWGVAGAFAGPLFANLIMLPVGLWITRDLLTVHLSRRWLRDLLHVGLPMIPAAFGGWLLAYANRYFLLYFSSAAAVGLLAVGNKVSAPLVLFTTALRTAWGPFAFSLQKQENARDIYAKTLTYFCTFCFTVAVGVGIFAREALLWFTTPDYVPGHVVAGLMAFQIIADACYYIVSIGITLAKKTRLLAYSVPAAALVSILLNIALIPTLGFFGAALANTLSYVFLTLLTYTLAQRVYPIPYEAAKILRLVLLAAAAWGLGISISLANLWVALGLKGLILLGFSAGLFLLRIVQFAEVNLAITWAQRQWANLRALKL